MDTNITLRASPLPWPESPSVAEWLAANAEQPTSQEQSATEEAPLCQN